jgi:rod shape-determining protein MreC
VLVLLSITIITLDFRGNLKGLAGDARSLAADAVHPVQRSLSSVVDPVEHFFEGAVDYQGALAKEERLRAEVRKLQNELATSSDARAELAKVLEQEHLPYATTIARIPAEAINFGTENFAQTVEIDRGSADGVRKGMPVVSGGGLVGRVIQVGSHEATVLELTDPTSRIGVRFPSGQLALAKGQGGGHRLLLELVAPSVPVKVGEVVTTAGLSKGLYPPGIPVGTVASVSYRPGELSKNVTLKPASDLGNLEFLSVLRWQPPKV